MSFSWRHHSTGFLQLLGSGLLSAAGLTAVASNRWNLLDKGTAVFFLLFIQWQTFSLTIAKCGIDNFIFATLSRDASLFINIRRAIFRTTLPLVAAASFLSFWIFPLWAVAAMGISVVLDSYSLMAIAETNAQAKFRKTAFANLLNYPLFLLGVAGLSIAGKAGSFEIAVTFLFSSGLRAVWLAAHRDHRELGKATLSVSPLAQVSLGTQQAGNYALFRIDQLIIGFEGARNLLSVSPAVLSSYLFLAKFPELCSGLFNHVGTVSFPAIANSDSDLRRWVTPWRITLITAALALGILLTGAGFRLLWLGNPRLTFGGILPFAIHAIFILPANAITYRLLSHGQLHSLLVRQGAALAVGALGLAILYLCGATDGLAWMVPIQLIAFTGLGFLLEGNAEGKTLPQGPPNGGSLSA